MTLLVAGLAVFFGVHLVPASPRVRARLVGGIGELPYKGAFSVIALAGLAMVVAGMIWVRCGCSAVARRLRCSTCARPGSAGRVRASRWRSRGIGSRLPSAWPRIQGWRRCTEGCLAWRFFPRSRFNRR